MGTMGGVLSTGSVDLIANPTNTDAVLTILNVGNVDGVSRIANVISESNRNKFLEKIE